MCLFHICAYPCILHMKWHTACGSNVRHTELWTMDQRCTLPFPVVLPACRCFSQHLELHDLLFLAANISSDYYYFFALNLFAQYILIMFLPLPTLSRLPPPYSSNFVVFLFLSLQRKKKVTPKCPRKTQQWNSLYFFISCLWILYNVCGSYSPPLPKSMNIYLPFPCLLNFFQNPFTFLLLIGSWIGGLD